MWWCTHDVDATVWLRLLDTLDHSIRQDSADRTHQLVICQTITMCLSYGADPHFGKFREILEWMRGTDCNLASSDVLEVQQALYRELVYTTPRSHIRMSHQKHLHRNILSDNSARQYSPVRKIPISRDNTKRRVIYPTEPENSYLHKRSRIE
jgi:hypothetical protein